jgi:hypothetical protein
MSGGRFDGCRTPNLREAQVPAGWFGEVAEWERRLRKGGGR